MTTEALRTSWAERRRKPRAVRALVGLIVVLLLVLVAAWGYDETQGDVIAAGVHAGHVQLGGLSTASARARLARVLAANGQRPLTVVAGGERVVIVPARAGIALDVDGTVARALAISRRGSFLSRDLRALTGGEEHANVVPILTPHSTAALGHLAARLDRRPRNAGLSPSPSGLSVTRSRAGIHVMSAAVTGAVTAALLSGAPGARVPIQRVPPTLTVADLRHRYPGYITIDRGRFTLRVYQHLHLARSYPIAVGMQGLQTPAGLYHILNKEVDPSWSVPNSPWAGSLAGQVIPPGPQDPLKARWLGFWDGSGIHGTDETDSIGQNASHGCVRMLIPDVIDLYNRVRVGTPVYIGD